MAGIQPVPPFRLDALSAHPALSRIALYGSGDWAVAGAVVAMPARNEAERIEASLRALLAELRPGEGIVLAVNGTEDDTLRRALELLRADNATFLLVDLEWQGGVGSAPLARRLAMDLAMELAPDAHFFSVDADTCVQPGWRDAYEAEFEQAALVCGAIGFDPAEAALLPPTDEDAETVLRDYRAASREIMARLDPDPLNPWPHHGNIGGANFGLRAGAYAAVGGLPVTPFGEDRALLRRVRALGLPVRFSGKPLVWTSCRLDGRARGGLSDELARSRSEADPLVDEELEPATVLERRMRSRVAFLQAATVAERSALLRDLGIDPDFSQTIASQPFVGEAWISAEAASPALARRRMRRSELARELPDMLKLLHRVRESA